MNTGKENKLLQSKIHQLEASMIEWQNTLQTTQTNLQMKNQEVEKKDQQLISISEELQNLKANTQQQQLYLEYLKEIIAKKEEEIIKQKEV